MTTNLARYEKDLRALLSRGDSLLNAMQYEQHPKEVKASLTKQFQDLKKRKPDQNLDEGAITKAAGEWVNELPSFKRDYQSWYSEASSLIRQVLPHRLANFVGHYEKPKGRKTLDFESYRISDYLQGTIARLGGEIKVDAAAAIPQFIQQLAILRSAEARFASSLFDIRQLVQADILDSELEAATELLKHRFTRAAGAVTGVVLEKHLAQVCENHLIKITKSKPTINDFNQALKDAGAIETETWRFIQFLADIRNACDHDRKAEPTETSVSEIISGVAKITKTLF
jgi:hypothetical protein